MKKLALFLILFSGLTFADCVTYSDGSYYCRPDQTSTTEQKPSIGKRFLKGLGKGLQAMGQAKQNQETINCTSRTVGSQTYTTCQ